MSWGAIAPVVGGIIGNQMAKGPAGEASAANELAIREMLKIKVPGISEQEIDLMLPELVGQYQAQLEGVEQMGPSGFENVSVDPRLKEMQMNALMDLAELGETGLTNAERGAMREIRRSAAGEAQARDKSVLQDMQRRGMGGSGRELAARLASSQGSADRMSAEGDRLSQMAQQRALQAMTQGSNLASNIRGQDYGEQSDLARARDVISQFNTQNRQQVGARNIDRTNQAALGNLGERQRIADTRTNLRNQEQMHNKGLIQQQFQNQVQRAGGVAAPAAALADTKSGEATRIANSWAGIGSGVGEGITAFNQKGK